MSDANQIGAMLAEPLERLLARHAGRESLSGIEAGQLPSGLWAEAEAIGAHLALVPEQLGGAGLPWRNIEPLLQVLGRHAAPLPLGETMLSAAMLAAASLEVPPGALGVIASPLKLDHDGRLHGVESLVAWAPMAEHFVAQGRRDTERFVCLVGKDEVRLEPRRSVGRIPSAAVKIHGATPIRIAAWAGPDPQCGMALLRAGQMAGALQKVLGLCVDYANTRQQFGKPIGKFQAIQHLLADLAIGTAAAQVAVMFGCRRFDAGAFGLGAAVAKIRSSRAAGDAAAAAHQVFGAIGITDEHLLHYLTRRLWQWRSEAGSEMAWAMRLGDAALAGGGEPLWPAVVGGRLQLKD